MEAACLGGILQTRTYPLWWGKAWSGGRIWELPDHIFINIQETVKGKIKWGESESPQKQVIVIDVFPPDKTPLLEGSKAFPNSITNLGYKFSN